MVNNILPFVSIITPSFNQGKFIRETIESVLSQEYKNLEHIVIDGGSSDETLQILKEYSKRDSRFRFVSEPDNGQSHALNKGLMLSQGEIIGWLNSDDSYLPGAVNHAVTGFNNNPNWSMIYGSANITNVENEVLSQFVARRIKLIDLFKSCPICQPAAFLRKKTIADLGGIDENLDFCMDYDLWIRIAIRGYEIGMIKEFLANSRYYPESKSGSKFADVGFPEIILTSKKHFGVVSSSWINLFLKHYRDKGVIWFLKLFKTFSLFQNSPTISETNFIENSWATKNLNCKIQNHASNPIHAIVIKGNQEKYENIPCSILLNGHLIRETNINKGSFELEIPISSKSTTNNFSLTCEKSINNGNENRIYRVSDMLALSKVEFEFLKEFEKGELYAKRWIKRYFKY